MIKCENKEVTIDDKKIIFESEELCIDFLKALDSIPFSKGLQKTYEICEVPVMKVDLKATALKDFHGGIAIAKGPDGYNLVYKNGEIISLHKYDVVYDFHQDLACVGKDGKYGFIDRSGNEVIPLEYNFAHNFSEGLALVQKDRLGLYGFIDKNGNEIIPLEYTMANDFSEGLAVVYKNGKCYYIDKDNNVVINCYKYNVGGSFHEGLARVKNDDDLWGFIDKNGKEIISCEYEEASDFQCGLARVEGKWGIDGFIDKAGYDVIPIKRRFFISMGRSFYNDLLLVKEDGKYKFTTRNFSFPFKLAEYDDALPFHEGLAAVNIKGKWRFINRQGCAEHSGAYDWVSSYYEGLAAVRKDNNLYYIDKNNHKLEFKLTVTKPEDLFNLPSNAKIKGIEKHKAINIQGNIIIPKSDAEMEEIISLLDSFTSDDYSEEKGRAKVLENKS